MDESTIKEFLNLNEKESKQLQNLTKKEMIGIITALSLRAQVQNEYIEKLEDKRESLAENLNRAEGNIKAAKNMIESVTEQW